MRSEITNNTTTTVTVTQIMSLRLEVAYAHVACVLVCVEFASELLFAISRRAGLYCVLCAIHNVI